MPGLPLQCPLLQDSIFDLQPPEPGCLPDNIQVELPVRCRVKNCYPKTVSQGQFFLDCISGADLPVGFSHRLAVRKILFNQVPPV